MPPSTDPSDRVLSEPRYGSCDAETPPVFRVPEAPGKRRASPTIEVVQDDITTLAVEAIVNPANSRLEMGGGLATVIRERGGEQIQEAARETAPVPVGDAVVTTAGNLPAEYVIHAPTMEQPARPVDVDNTRRAMDAGRRRRWLRLSKRSKLIGLSGWCRSGMTMRSTTRSTRR